MLTTLIANIFGIAELIATPILSIAIGLWLSKRRFFLLRLWGVTSIITGAAQAIGGAMVLLEACGIVFA